jgi:predicted acyl esterase
VQPAQRFVLGPGSHASAVYNPNFLANDPGSKLKRDYVRAYLKQEAIDLSGAPTATYYATGAEEWRTSPTWPPAGDRVELFLSGTALGPSPAAATTQVLHFDPAAIDACQDPNHPAQTGFLSAPMTAPLELAGAPELLLTVATDTPDADLSAMIYEVTPGGQYPWYGQQRLRLRFRDSYTAPAPMPAGVPTPVRLRFGTSAHRIAAGNQLGLVLGMTECGLPENPGTGGPMMTGTETHPTTLTLSMGPGTSRLALPVAR